MTGKLRDVLDEMERPLRDLQNLNVLMFMLTDGMDSRSGKALHVIADTMERHLANLETRFDEAMEQFADDTPAAGQVTS
ncbi:hypothetical protein ABIE65_004978 [Constrictibacter sp. MBR-5]|jgi:hypothetical protein|uniref:hypothetical protein n=1 Tax=Constrictibacter sp. MBR-5 TaxID=3156467 RepID=UPI003395B49A